MFGNKSKKEVVAASHKQPESAHSHPEDHAKPSPPPGDMREHDDDDEAANYISASTVIEGNIISSEDLHIDGTVKGDIKTAAKLILGEDSVIEGNIMSEEAEVAGRIQGTVQTKGLLAIRSTCVIDGDIVTKSLNVESGSSFNGRCKVGASVERPGKSSGAPTSQKPVVATKSAPVSTPAPTKP